MTPFSVAALYVHIPFCRSRCIYCDFNTYGGVGRAEREKYQRALLRDLSLSARILDSYNFCADNLNLRDFWLAGPWAFAGSEPKADRNGAALQSVYFGGGTPSYAPAEWLTEALECIKRAYNIDKDAEITLEANPGTLCLRSLSMLRRAGFNRISIGVQSLDDRLLRQIGRIHNAAEAVEAVRMARQAGFENINLDLIYGLPGQTEAIWRATLQDTIALKPEHISCYALSIEEGTPLEGQLNSGCLKLPSDEECEAMEGAGEALLSGNGFRQYEISNYARDGFYCRHNLIYWNNLPYLGVGAGAVSYINGWRMTREKLPGRFAALIDCGMIPYSEGERLDLLSRWREYLMLGLRTVEGINVRRLWERFPEQLKPALQRRLKEFCAELPPGLLKLEGSRLFFSSRGLKLSNEIFVRILEDGAAARIFKDYYQAVGG